MKRLQTLAYVLTGVATFGLILPQQISAANYGRAPIVPVQATGPEPMPQEAGPPRPLVISDVGLDEEGALSGQVVDRQGAPLEQTAVTVRSRGTIAALATTDEQGRFAVHNLRGGTYEVASAGGGGLYRVWTSGASPPAASDQVLIMADDAAAPGQNGQPSDPQAAGCPCNCQCGQCCNGQCCGGPCCNGQCGPNCRNYPLRRMQGCRCCPVTNGQVVMTGLYMTGFAGLITGIVIAAVNLHEEESSS